MSRYSIDGSILTSLGDAIREKTGKYTRDDSYEAIYYFDISKPEEDRHLDFDIYCEVEASSVKFKIIAETGAENGRPPMTLNRVVIHFDENNEAYSEGVGYGGAFKANYTQEKYANYTCQLEVTFYDADGNVVRCGEGEVTNTLTPQQMVDEIRSIETGGGIEVEPIVLTGDCTAACTGLMASKYIELFGDTISTENLTKTNEMFKGSALTVIPFSINISDNGSTMANMFELCSNLVELPEMHNVTVNSTIGYMFQKCKSLRYLPNDFGADWNWDKLHADSNGYVQAVFQQCYSLRNIPETFIKQMWTANSAYFAAPYSSFAQCYALDELTSIPVVPGTYNGSSAFGGNPDLHRIKNYIFEVNEDGTPKTANWKSQTIDLSNAGYTHTVTYITGHNSGITADTRVTDDATYQALKDNPDWWTADMRYSRYDHDSAVRTINSLPDTSAYIAANGGSNIIKFRSSNGNAGSLTDGGAIANLTDEEIAVAAAKGWTVTLTN